MWKYRKTIKNYYIIAFDVKNYQQMWEIIKRECVATNAVNQNRNSINNLSVLLYWLHTHKMGKTRKQKKKTL